MGPPSIVPSEVLTRYFTASTASAYLVDSRKRPSANTQDGPALESDRVATPTMLPVPIVAASAVASAPK
jgi:hypothetical protein